MSNIQFEESGPPVLEADIAAFERKHRVTLPAAYRNFLLAVNGGHPEPSGTRILIDGALVSWRLHFFLGLNDPVESCNLEWVTQLTERTRPKGMIPIARDEGGNFFYIDVRLGHGGAIYFGPTPCEQEVTKPILLSLDFDSFVGSLSDV